MMDTFLVREEEPSEHKEKPSETLRFQGFVVDLSQLYSNQNTYLKINKSKAKSSSIPDTSVKLREAEKCSVNEHGETEVKKICQKQRILSKKEREKIKEQYMQGVSTEELAKSFGCHRVTISKALRKAGVTPTIEKLNINDAIRMYESGSTTKEIAEKYHMADNTVSHRLKMAGVKMRNRWDYR